MADANSSSSSSSSSSRSSIEIMPRTKYQWLLFVLRNEEDIIELRLNEEYEEENADIINEIINLMQMKTSVKRVQLKSVFLQSIPNEAVVALFDAIVTLPNLEYFWIHRPYNDSGEWQECNLILLRNFLTKLLLEGRKLKDFRLARLDISDEIGVDVVQKLRKFKTLKLVSLKDLNLGIKTAFNIADWLQDSSSSLEELHLVGNDNIGMEGYEDICNALENNSCLKILRMNELCFNPNVGLERFESICNTLEKTFVLETLYIKNYVAQPKRCKFHLILNKYCNNNNNNKLSIAGDLFCFEGLDVDDEICVDIIQKLQKLKTLKNVRMFDLKLSNKTIYAIVDWLKDSSSCLKHLHCNGNIIGNIDPEGYKAISNALENNFLLEYLQIGPKFNSFDQRYKFYLILNEECNRNMMMRSVGNDGGNILTRDDYMNNLIETSHGRTVKLQLSMVYYWIRMKPSVIINC